MFGKIFKYAVVGLLIGLCVAVITSAMDIREYSAMAYVYIVVYSVIITATIWEGCLRIDNFAPKRWSWKDDMIKLSLWSLFYCFVVSVPVMVIFMYHLSFVLKLDFSNFLVYIYLGVFMSFIISIVNISSRIEKEFLETKAKEQYYINSQKHLAPHFLFNSLSVLNALINIDPKLASEFTNHLSDVYRYILQYKDKKTHLYRG